VVPEAEDRKAVGARESDLRVTSLGDVLPKTHADEFCQFLDTLKGQMSAAGPPPEHRRA